MTDITLTTSLWKLDPPWTVAAIRSCPGGGWFDDHQVRMALQHSLVVSAHDGPKQVGVLRVVTDYYTFSTITEVFVDEKYRGRGIGGSLVERALEEVGKTPIILQARPVAQMWYMKWGFSVLANGIMVRAPK